MTDQAKAKFADLTTKKDRVARLREMLGTNAKWAIAGLSRIYANQTADEQDSGMTSEDNGIGFTGVDAEILSSFAEQVEKGRTLSPKQMTLLFKKMPKYAKQLEGVSTPVSK